VTDSATPTSFEEAAATLRAATASGREVRIAGAGTKLGWLESGAELDHALALTTVGLREPIEHHA
jgi:hypothetical protein